MSGMITLNIVKPWSVRTPTVYRYMDAQYVERFFATGELRLTPMRIFRAYTCEQRGDTHEGGVLNQSRGKDGFQFNLMSPASELMHTFFAPALCFHPT